MLITGLEQQSKPRHWQTLSLSLLQLDQDPRSKYWTVYTDGSSASSMGGVGVILLSSKKDILKYGVQLQFHAMNNEAEYEAVWTSLRVAKALGVRNLKLNFDSKLMTGQMNNEYEAKEDRMKRYLALINQLISNFDDVKITQVSREENSTTDEVAKLASLDIDEGRCRLYMEVQNLPSIDSFDVNHIQLKACYMDPIVTYIRNGNLPTNPTEARKVKVMSSRFTILNDKLYKRGFSQPYLKCLDPEDVEYMLIEIYEGVCGNHSGPRSFIERRPQPKLGRKLGARPCRHMSPSQTKQATTH